jgi:aminopeptidase N
VIAEARRRFAAFVADRSTLAPDEQGVVLGIVGTYADQATFDQIHALAKTAKNETEGRRYFGSLEIAKDPKLAQQGMEIALSPEIPPQAANAVPFLIFSNIDWNPALSFAFLKEHGKQVFAAWGGMNMVAIAIFVPPAFADAAPLDQVQAWITSLVPPGSDAYIQRGMASARLQQQLKARIVQQADAALAPPAHS